MENEDILKQFEEIEQKIGKLIDVCKSLEAANLELKSKIQKLEEELQGKAKLEKRYQEQNAMIRSKVDGLLARLEDITEA